MTWFIIGQYSTYEVTTAGLTTVCNGYNVDISRVLTMVMDNGIYMDKNFAVIPNN